MEKTKEIKVGKDTFEINLDEKDLAIVERQFTKYTKFDLEIRNLAIPKSPKWLNIIVRVIRSYQRNVAPRLGNRCVFDPSCSHYSELAFRKKGFLQGFRLTLKRLYRCRPSNGGIDLII